MHRRPSLHMPRSKSHKGKECRHTLVGGLNGSTQVVVQTCLVVLLDEKKHESMEVTASQSGHLENKPRRQGFPTSRRRGLAKRYFECSVDLAEAGDEVAPVVGVDG